MEHENTISMKLMDTEARNSNLEMRGSTSNPVHHNDDAHSSTDTYNTEHAKSRATLKTLTHREFYKQEGWVDEMCEILFKIKRRGTTIKAELYYGVLHFICCCFCLAVVPQQLTNAGYSSQKAVVAVALTTGVATIFCGLFANLPFVLAPPTAVSIFFSVFLQQKSEGPHEGNIAAILSGIILIFFGWRPLGKLANRLIPLSIQVGTAVGIGLLTALAGSTEINLVVAGNYVILEIGQITTSIVIAFVGVILICVFMRYHWQGSFCVAVIVCSLLYWMIENDFPGSVASKPELDTFKSRDTSFYNTPLFTVDLVFLYILYLNGLMTSLTNLAALTRDDETIPRGRWVYIMCGVFTVFAGLVSSAPILISPESSASIKEGAKTGLSAVVAGVLFLISLFFSPIFQQVPSAGTSPVLIMIGVVLFQNVSRIDWKNITFAAPAFMVLFYIPFTYSIIQGVILGYIVYLIVSVFTGEIIDNGLWLLSFYSVELEDKLIERFNWQDRKSVQSRKTVAKSMSHHSASEIRHAQEQQHHAEFGLGNDMMSHDSEVGHSSMTYDHERPSNLYNTDINH